MAKNWGTQTPVESHRVQRNFKRSRFVGIAFFCLVLWGCLRYYIIGRGITPQWYLNPGNLESKARCPQVEPLHPVRNTQELDDVDNYLKSEAFRDIEIKRLSGAVQIPTQSFDDMGDIGTDPRWDIFYSFADYLSKTYPLTHATLQLEKSH